MNKVEKKLLVHGGDVVVVGIDIAKKKHYARIYNQMDLDIIKPFSFHNSRDGFYRLVSKIIAAKEKAKAKSVVVGMETHGPLLETLSLVFKRTGLHGSDS